MRKISICAPLRVGDRIYASVFIDLFPKDVQSFVRLFARTLQTHIPWRISFLVESNGLGHAGIRSALASVLTITSRQNRLISDSLKLLSYINLSADDAVVRLKVTAATWAPEGDMRLLRSRASMLSRAIQGWGSCDVSEISGDAYEGVVSSMLARVRRVQWQHLQLRRYQTYYICCRYFVRLRPGRMAPFYFVRPMANRGLIIRAPAIKPLGLIYFMLVLVLVNQCCRMLLI